MATARTPCQNTNRAAGGWHDGGWHGHLLMWRCSRWVLLGGLGLLLAPGHALGAGRLAWPGVRPAATSSSKKLSSSSSESVSGGGGMAGGNSAGVPSAACLARRRCSSFLSAIEAIGSFGFFCVHCPVAPDWASALSCMHMHAGEHAYAWCSAWSRSASRRELAGLPDARVHNQVALDFCQDALTHYVQKWAGAIVRGLHKLDYAYGTGFYALRPLHCSPLLQLVGAPGLHSELNRSWMSAREPACQPLCVHTNGGLLGLSTCASQGPC